MVVLTIGVDGVLATYVVPPTTTAGVAATAGVVIVVVVVTARVGGGGGGAETRCDSGSEAQPEKRASTPPKARMGASGQAARTWLEDDERWDGFFTALEWTPYDLAAMGCSRQNRSGGFAPT